MTTIPMLNLVRQQEIIQEELDQAIFGVIRSGKYVSSKTTTSFETKLARYCGKKYALGVGSGSSALVIALLANGIKPGAEVITVPNSFFATSEAIIHIGAIPVFIDIDPDTHLMNLELLAQAITPKTQAIIPVHLFGNVLDCKQIQHITRSLGRDDIRIIEDCAHSFGSKLSGCSVPIGNCGAFSFNPGKNCGAFGDAGAIVTSDDEVAEKIKLLRDHGRSNKNHHLIMGFNSRLSALNDSVLSVKIEYIDQWNDKRRETAALYTEHFFGKSQITPIKTGQNVLNSFHQYVVKVNHREELRVYLKSNGISTGIHYPKLITQQPFFTNQGDHHSNRLKVSYDVVSKQLSLPCYPDLERNEVNFIIDNILTFLNKSD